MTDGALLVEELLAEDKARHELRAVADRQLDEPEALLEHQLVLSRTVHSSAPDSLVRRALMHARTSLVFGSHRKISGTPPGYTTMLLPALNTLSAVDREASTPPSLCQVSNARLAS